MTERDPLSSRNHECLRALHLETREELDRVDRKANTLFATLSVLVGAVVAGIIAGSWDPAEITPRWLQVGWWIGAGVVIFSLISLLQVVAPQHIHPIPDSKGQLRFFGDIAAFQDQARFTDYIQQSNLDEEHRIVDQVWVLSTLVADKYLQMRLVVRRYLIGVGITSATLVVAWMV